MQFFGLFGEHLSHSYSERIHSTFFDLIGMNAGYKHIELSPIELEAAIEGIRVLQFVGVNVTIPYKQTVMPYLMRSPRSDAHRCCQHDQGKRR